MAEGIFWGGRGNTKMYGSQNVEQNGSLYSNIAFKFMLTCEVNPILPASSSVKFRF